VQKRGRAQRAGEPQPRRHGEGVHALRQRPRQRMRHHRGGPAGQQQRRHQGQQQHVLRHVRGQRPFAQRIQRPQHRQAQGRNAGGERAGFHARHAAADAGLPPQSQQADEVQRDGARQRQQQPGRWRPGGS
jgi:hypothetical protein